MTDDSSDTSDVESFLKQRRARSQRFALKAFYLVAAVHVYVGLRLLPDLPLPPAGLIGVIFGLVLSSLLIPFGTLARSFIDNQTAIDRLNWVGGLLMGWFSSLGILTLLRDIALLLSAIGLFPDRMIWAENSVLAILALSVAVSLLGFYNARRVAKVITVNLPIPDLPKALDGFTIAQISDIHIGPTIRRRFVERIVQRVNDLKVDAVALTGDIIDGPVSKLADDAAPLAGLTSRHGSFLVTGNHEYYHHVDDWLPIFDELGLNVLQNQHRSLDHDGAAIVIAGVNDYSTNSNTHPHVSDADLALSGAPEAAPKIMLAHQPRSADASAQAGAHAQLSGHTHGGQFWPWNYFVRLQQPYTAGLHRHGALWVYTSRGTGYWGPPKRFGAPSEITRIILRPA